MKRLLFITCAVLLLLGCREPAAVLEPAVEKATLGRAVVTTDEIDGVAEGHGGTTGYRFWYTTEPGYGGYGFDGWLDPGICFEGAPDGTLCGCQRIPCRDCNADVQPWRCATIDETITCVPEGGLQRNCPNA